MTNRTAPAPTAGLAATRDFGRLGSDTVAYVVTRVSASGQTLWAQRVELDETSTRPEWTPVRGEIVPTLTDGKLDKPYGDPERFSLRPSGHWQRGEYRLTLGHSVRRRDWRD